MNDLQLALLILGGLIVAAVFLHGKWQEHRQKKMALGMLEGTSGDALLGGEDSSRPSEVPTARPGSGGERREPTLGEYGGGARGAADPVRPATSGPTPVDAGEPELPLLSPEADYIAAFALVEPVDFATLEAMPPDALQGIKKRVAWVGFNETARQWEEIRPQGHYRLLRVGLQLADRSGPLSSGLLDQFRTAMEKVGDELTAVAELPNPRDAVVRSVHLDKLCAEVDIQLNVQISPRHGYFLPDTVREAAMAVGFQLESDGVLGYPDASGQRLFALQMPAARIADGLPAPTISLLLEVPCVDRGERAFDRMMAIAQELADALDGIVVDEQRRPITDRFVLPVRQQIVDLQARMAAQGVPPGSLLALRLFS